MNHTQVKNGNQKKATASLRGEAPQEHGSREQKKKRTNPKTEAARNALIEMSKKAQDMMRMAKLGIRLDGFEHCRKVNDYLLVIHQKSSGCNTFKTFIEWKSEGYKVKKGEKAYRIWGSPLKAKQNVGQSEEGANDGNDEQKTVYQYKYWPMCCLFNENQVEPMT